MPIVHNPATIAAPGGRYSHGVEIETGARMLYVSGQVGADARGFVPPTAGEQAALAWANIRAILEAAGMEPRDIVKINTYLIDPRDAPAAAEARRAVLGDHAPASTLVAVAALMQPAWKIEIEAIATRVGPG